MTINEKLLKIQLEIKVPKSKPNRFGGFKYRTVDMVLEKVKPLTEKYKCVLILQDELVLIGERYYIRSTAILLDLESDSNIATSAYAREQLERKKSDDSQLTGAASTYARKYALTGLFLLDDNDIMDPDSYAGDDEPKEQEAEEQEQEQEPKKRTRRGKKKEESLEDYMNPPETPDGAEELPFSDKDITLKEDTYFFIEKDNNYVMKHAGDNPPEGGKVITKEEFVKGSVEIATGQKKHTRRRKVRSEQTE